MKFRGWVTNKKLDRQVGRFCCFYWTRVSKSKRIICKRCRFCVFHFRSVWMNPCTLVYQQATSCPVMPVCFKGAWDLFDQFRRTSTLLNYTQIWSSDFYLLKIMFDFSGAISYNRTYTPFPITSFLQPEQLVRYLVSVHYAHNSFGRSFLFYNQALWTNHWPYK